MIPGYVPVDIFTWIATARKKGDLFLNIYSFRPKSDCQKGMDCNLQLVTFALMYDPYKQLLIQSDDFASALHVIRSSLGYHHKIRDSACILSLTRTPKSYDRIL